MKKIIAAAALTVLASLATFAIKADDLEVALGGQKRAVAGGITVKFIAVIEDSRCPRGTQCVWAGNAKVKIGLSKGRKAKTVELDSNVGNTLVQFQGYGIKFVSLRPEPGEKVKMVAFPKRLTVSIKKHV
jgi:hypothetical protein